MSLLLVAVRQVIRRSPEIEAQIGAALGRCRCYTGHMGSLAEETRWVDGVESAAMIARGDVTPAELLDAAIERIESDNDRLNAVSVSWFEHARSVAADPALPEGPFRGVPFLLKDLYAQFAGQPLTNGNVALKKAGHVADFDTTLVSRYKAAGLVIAGRTNSPEMGTVPTTEPLAHGPTRNPWNTGAHPRRIEWRGGGRRGSGHGSLRPRLRWRGQHPHPGLVLWAGGSQTEPRPDLDGTGT
jgi:Asp-tRNA(Asn)/Glu-tRNA(Gln) amidotransferase A subunit family amidase